VTGPERIETARLVLRRPRAGDAEAIFSRYASDPDATRYMSWPTHRAIEATRAFLAHSEAEWRAHPAGAYLIEGRAGGPLLGGTGVHFENPVRAATGYILARDAWGVGYATEALRAVVALAARLGVLRLQALCHLDHAASQRVLEKCGFTREGVLRRHTAFPNLGSDGPVDVLCYARIFD
jgi:RimJ/RimL family protein N-acetyltransferase